MMMKGADNPAKTCGEDMVVAYAFNDIGHHRQLLCYYTGSFTHGLARLECDD